MSTAPAVEPELTPTSQRIAFQLLDRPVASATGESGAPAPPVQPGSGSSSGNGNSSPPASNGSDQPSSVSSAAESSVPFGIIVDDGAALGEGQVYRTQFMTALSAEIERVAGEELAPTGQSAHDCPYLIHWLNFYREQSALHIERAIQRYADPGSSDLAAVQSAVLARVRTAVRAWIRSGGREVQAPEGVSWFGSDDRVSDNGAAAGVVQRLAFEGPTAEVPPASDPAAVRARLSSGHSLDGGVRGRMESGFGQSFSGVRFHTDVVAENLANSFSARAFTIGNDVAFGTNQYRPGTLTGDAIIAHELAHVLQQRGSTAPTDHSQIEPASAPLEHDADRAAVHAVARGGFVPEELTEHLDIHQPEVQGAGLRLQRCNTDNVDYEFAPEPPDYNVVVTELRELYAKKLELGRAEELDETALEGVNAEIQIRLDQLRMLGVTADDYLVESKITDPAGAQELRRAEPVITRSPADGPIYVGRRIRFQLSTDWLPPDEVPEIEWRWQANDEDFALMDKTGLSCELDTDYWGTFANAPGIMDAHEWREAGGVSFYAKIKLGEKAAVLSNKIYIPFDKRLPHEIEGFKFEIVPAKAAIVVGEDPNVHVKDFTIRTSQYWVEWTVEGEVINLAPGMGGGILARPFDSIGTKHMSARLFSKADIEAKTPLAESSTTVEVQDPEKAGRETLARGEELGVYTPLSGYKQSHDAAMSEMGTRAKLGETGRAQEYWQQRLNAKAAQLKSLEEKVPDYESTTNVEGKDYAAGLTAAVSSTPVPAVLVYPNASQQVVQPVSIYLLTRKSGDKWTASVLDISGKVYRFDGGERDSSIDAAASAFEAWKSDNKYPTGGKVVYTFSPPGWTFDATFSTTSSWKVAEEFLDGLIAVGTYVAVGLLLLAPEATITKVLGVALMAAVAARGGMAISDNLGGGGKLLDKENILEMVIILTSIIGGAGGVMKTMGSAARASTLFRAGNWMVMTSLVAGGGTLVYATTESLAAIRQVLKDPTIGESERSQQVLSIIASSIANVTMFVISTRAMLSSGLKASDFFKKTIPAKGAGPIEMTEGMRIDLEVALRARGVKPEALKLMSSEVLIDTYYEVTATRPELVRIPDNLKSSPVPDIVSQLNLPAAPAGYKWMKTGGGRLTIAKNKGTQGDKLLYDPEGAPGKEFIPEPTVLTPSKVQVVKPLKVSPAEVQVAADDALTARQAITGVPEGKTVARAKDGTSKTSGWGSDIKSLEPVEKLATKIGHQSEPNMNDAAGRPGSYHNSHAEKQLAAVKTGEPIGVSRPMCLDCQIFFGKLAASTGKAVVVSDPLGLRVFVPNKPMITAPNATAAAAAVASASKESEKSE